MKHEEFIAKVAELGALPHDRAEQAANATLQTLGEVLPGDEAEDLAAQLPGELRPALAGAGASAERFGADEFVRRVSRREGSEISETGEHVRAVLATVEEAVTGGQLEDLVTELPGDYLGLFGAGSSGGHSAG